MTEFNLANEPWIPAATSRGTTLLSTRELLARAHELRDLDLASPLEEVAVTRHLLAVLHRALDGPRDLDHWVDLYERGAFDSALVDRYLDSVADRMDLFHPHHPFAQTRGLTDTFGFEAIDEMTIARRNWGESRALFQHRPLDHRPSMTPAQAARALLAYQAYDTGGLVKKPGEPTSASAAPLLGCAVVLVKGRSVFETLLSNLLVYDRETKPVHASETDAPAWERDPPPASLPLAKEPKRTPDGWLDQLTWLSRRLELVERGGQVIGFTRCVYQGLSDEAPREPMAAYRLDPKRGILPIGLRVGRAFWRDSHALFRTRDQQSTLRPKTLDQLASLVVEDAVPAAAPFRLDVVGVAANKSRIDLVRVEALRSLGHMLADPAVGETIRHIIALAESLVAAMEKALWNYATKLLSMGDRPPDKGDVKNLVKSLGAASSAWSALGERYFELLDRLIEGRADAPEQFERDAAKDIRALAIGAMSGSATSPRWLKARAVGETSLYRELNARLTKETA